MKKIHKKGFTLVELLLVIMITVILLSVAVGGLINSQKTFIFRGAEQSVSTMVREARSFAVTGKAQIDFTDYDNDGCKQGEIGAMAAGHVPPCTLDDSQHDYVTPVHYGIYFDGTTSPNRMIMFADMHGSATEGAFDDPGTLELNKYVPGRDMILNLYELPENYRFILTPNDGNTYTIMYTPIFADTVFDEDPVAVDKFFVFGIRETDGTRTRCYAVHPVSGVPESTEKVGIDCS